MTSIGICGFARSGKDTAAKYLIDKGIVSKKYSFADPLKEMVNTLFKWDERHSDGEFKEEECLVNIDVVSLHNFIFLYQEKYRLHIKYPHVTVFQVIEKFFSLLDVKYNEEALVYVGKFSPRKAYQIFGTEIGREILDENIWIDLTPDDDIVLADIRFPNEYKYLKSKGIPILRIVNEQKKGVVRPHESEKYIDTFDCEHVIINNMNEEFFDEIDTFIETVLS